MVREGFRRTVLIVFALSLVLVPWTAAAAPLVENAQVDPDNVLLRVSIQSDGSAVWQVEYRMLLDDENATEAFESLAADIEANRTTYTDRFADRMHETVSSAENATGREMAARNASVHTTRSTIMGPDREYGVVVYSFRWTGFAVVNGDRMEAGDAVAGLFLDEQTQMILSWPDEYRLLHAAPDTDTTRENAVVWDGRIDFALDEPRIDVTSAPATTTSASDSGSVDDSPGDDSIGDDSLPDVLLLATLALVATLGAAGWLFVRRSRASVSTIDDAEASGAEQPEELLSNEERVLRLLEEHDGRMKQQQVAQQLDWTDAKTSQVVGDLREDGSVEVFRLGRENVLSLPGEDEL